MMEFQTKEISGIPILSPQGNLLGDRENHSLHAEAMRLIETKPKALILDLTNVRFMVSAGLGLMVAEYRQAAECGVRLMLTNLQTRVRELLYITHLDAYLKDYGTVDEAVAAAAATTDTPQDSDSAAG